MSTTPFTIAPRQTFAALTLAVVSAIAVAPAAPALNIPLPDVLGAVAVQVEAARSTNDMRAGRCAPLAPSERLSRAAQRHAEDMAKRNYFSHTSASGKTWDARIRAAGFKKPAGENIAYGYTDGEDVVQAWMDSPGHRRNIMDCSFKRVGYGQKNGYWVQDFGY